MCGEAYQLELLNLLLMITVAVVVPILSARVHIPSAVLLIFLGILLGPHGAKVIQTDQVGKFLSEVGFLVLMFLAGLEIDFNGIRRKGISSLVVIGIISLVVFGLAFLAAWILGVPPIFGLALGATSVGLPLAVLKESEMAQTRLGQSVLLMGSVGELITVLGMSLYYFLGRYGFSLELAIAMGKLFGLLLLAGMLLRIMVAMAWWNPERFEKLVAKQDGSEVGVRAALMLAVGFAVLAAVAGVEGIVGAFLAGSVMAFVLRGKHVLENKLSVIGQGFFIPIFFIWIGMEFDPDLLTLKVILDTVIFVTVAFVIRLLPSTAMLRHGLSFRQVLASTTLLSAPLTLVVAIVAVGTSLQTLDKEKSALLVTMALAAGVVFPGIFKIMELKHGSKGQGRNV